ncbi:hypothetical protein Tco_1011904 [Tanacetum coccineum]
MEQPVVFAVSSCKATIYGRIQLSGTPATHYYFNPDIPGLEELHEHQLDSLARLDPLPVGMHKPLQIAGPFQIEEIPTDPLPVRTPTQLPGISGSAQTITVTPLPTTSETPGTYPQATGTTEGQPTNTPNPRAETTTKNTKRTLYGQESPGESKKKKE